MGAISPPNSLRPPASAPGPVPAWEKRALIGVVAAFLAVGLHNLGTGAFSGQDFSLHALLTKQLMATGRWFSFDFTNRPLQYWIGAACLRIAGDNVAWRMAGTILLLMNVAALFFLHACARRLLTEPWLRLAAVTFAAFLPVTMTASIVYAADATTQLPFFAALWCLLQALETRDGPRHGWLLAGAGLALIVGNLGKLTFIFLPGALILAVGLLWRRGELRAREAGRLILYAAVGPLLVGGAIAWAASRAVAEEKPRHIIMWRGTGEMTWSSLLLPKPGDYRIFGAPGYWNRTNDDTTDHFLLRNNDFSYPALLYLGTFTDVLDVTDVSTGRVYSKRPEERQNYALIAVWLGLPFFFGAAGCLACFLVRVAGGAAVPRLLPPAPALLVGALSCGWFFPIAGMLPYLHHAYDWGYWLPRLIVPAVWSFSLLTFAALEPLGRRRWATAGLVVFVLLQAMVQVCSLWYPSSVGLSGQ